MAALWRSQHPRQVLVVLLGHLLWRAPYLFYVNFLHHLKHFINAFVFELVVPDAVDHLQIVMDGLPEVGGVYIFLLLPVRVLRHVEGVVHLLLHRLTEFGHEALKQVQCVEVPRKLSYVMERILFIIEVGIAADLSPFVLLKDFAPLLCLIFLRFLFFLLHRV